MGRLQQRKRVDLLLQACANLPEPLKPDLWIVGDGPDRSRLEGLGEQVYPEAVFTGNLQGEQLDQLLDKADLFVLPGTGGLAVQQALAHALPVIVGEADGTQLDLVRPENGWVVNPGDLDSLQTAIQAALLDPPKLRRMGLKSYEIVLNEVNLEGMVSSFSDAVLSTLRIEPMRILLVADGRSPITRQWIKGLLRLQHQVILVSTFPCSPVEGTIAQDIIPVAFAGLSGSQVEQVGGKQKSGGLKKAVAGSRSSFLKFRYWLGPLTLPFYRQHFTKIIQGIQPDLVHALRIPFEGMLASYTPPGVPLAVSIWGNDLTLHAAGSKWMQNWTERTLRRADGLAADANRDLRLAKQWGFDQSRPTLLVPGNGGIDLTEIHRPGDEIPDQVDLDIPVGSPLVINPRGFRPGSVRNDVFFQAVSLVLEKKPGNPFCLPGNAAPGRSPQLGKPLPFGEKCPFASLFTAAPALEFIQKIIGQRIHQCP